MKPIAIAVYINDGGDLYSIELFTQEEVDKVKTGYDIYVRENKAIIVYSDMTTTDHT